MSKFVDRVMLHVQAGDGGHGCSSVHREKFKPLGGPDGGNGGNGGDVVLVVDPNVHTLLDFHFRPHAKAGNGRPGAGDDRDGANGRGVELKVPEGTVVLDERGRILADLMGMGTRFVAARGGRGGLGNASLASKTRKAPGFALLGEPGETSELVLELKSLADVGLVGFPSAGKSSLVSVLSAARPKIADYPFTTLTPHLGVVTAGSEVFTVADVPGLIPGASQGKGLGLEFLRHIERCSVLVHVIDCATYEPGRDPASDIAALEAELAEYSEGRPVSRTDDEYSAGRQGGTGFHDLRDLADRPRLVVLNKIDVPEARELADFVRGDLEAAGHRVFPVSTATHEGLDTLRYALAEVVAQDRAARPEPVAARIIVRPVAVDDAGFSVGVDPEEEGGYLVTGARPERWILQTDFTNDEAVGYLADRLARLGVEEKLAKLGAVPGAHVRVGDISFDWEPTGYGDFSSTGRGTDQRLDLSERIGAEERKAMHRVRRGLPVVEGRYAGSDGAEWDIDQLDRETDAHAD